MKEILPLLVLRFLPRNLLSRAFGFLAARRRPRFLVRAVIRWWARHFEVNVDEADGPLEDYPSLLAFFTRGLREGARPIDGDDKALVSPVDGNIGALGRIDAGRLWQIKGMDYDLVSLLGSEEAARPFLNGSFVTVYLSPRDYHRIHAPDGGRVLSTIYCPGTLWPVNPPAVRRIPRLFAINERATTVLDTPQGRVAVVMVGATNVGSIRLAYDDFVTNRGQHGFTRIHDPVPRLERGQHLATFELGSTVVLLVESPDLSLGGLVEGTWVGMGSRIGEYR